MDTLAKYYEKAVSSSVGGNIYQPFTLFERLSHERRMALLADLPLPDLSEATVVDYGVGSWGFGCIFPKLKACKKAIGIDISQTAIELSRKISTDDPTLSGKVVEFYTSSGYAFPIKDSSVDVFFAGECIEHIEDTDLFLAEIQRVLKPGGVGIFTTPNATPFVYRKLGYKWCMSFEHVALMTAKEFVGYLGKYFRLEVTKGFNQTLHPNVDSHIDEAAARAWVNAGENDLENASGMIAMARKAIGSARLDSLRDKFSVKVVEYDEAVARNEFRDVPIVEGVSARLIAAGGEMAIRIPPGAQRCSLIFWSHAWSGVARICVGGIGHSADLYSHVGGCLRVQISHLGGGDLISIEALAEKRDESQGNEVIFLRAVFVSPNQA